MLIVREMTDQDWHDVQQLPEGQNVRYVGELLIIDDHLHVLGMAMIVGPGLKYYPNGVNQ